jgi:hypothetical protein
VFIACPFRTAGRDAWKGAMFPLEQASRCSCVLYIIVAKVIVNGGQDFFRFSGTT